MSSPSSTSPSSTSPSSTSPRAALTPRSSVGKRTTRPGELNKFIVSLIFAGILALFAFLIFYWVNRSNFTVPGLLTLATFILSFIFTSIFQAIRCPYNPAAVSIASGVITAFVLLFISLLSIPFTGSRLIWVVDTAFPYVPSQGDQSIVKEADKEVFDPTSYSKEDKHKYSRAYAYWIFWAALLPMHTLIGLLGSC
jgi:multisubunit Na+/H+ antiporter MnhB subunit